MGYGKKKKKTEKSMSKGGMAKKGYAQGGMAKKSPKPTECKAGASYKD